LVDFEVRVNRKNGSVGFGVSWETIKIEVLWGIRDPLIESLELVTFEWNGSVLATVGDEETVVLVRLRGGMACQTGGVRNVVSGGASSNSSRIVFQVTENAI